MIDLQLNKKALPKFIENIDLNKKILEVGPLQTPLFTKNDADIYYADINNTDEIRERFSNDSKVNADKIVPIDYVINKNYENTFKNKDIKFDYVLLNNVFEHIPNPIEYLLDIKHILNKNGKIGLLLPDKEFSIDYYRENTSFTDWFDVYMRGERNNTPRLALDFLLNHIYDRNARNFWNKEIQEYPTPNLFNCMKQYSNLIKDFDNNYFDEHYWAFTDRSFLRIIENLYKLNIIPYKIHSFYPTAYNDNVFGIIFELDEHIQNNKKYREDEINKIHNIINYIEKKHFEIFASDIIRENNTLKEIIKNDNFKKELGWENTNSKEFFKNIGSLKKTVKGLDNYLFLINDGNSELKQHFDKQYKTVNFNPELFKKYFKIKTELFNKKNIKPYYFIVPDKSVVCKDFLPFNHDNYLRRNYNHFKDLFPDFVDELSPKDYFKHDTHMKFSGGRKIAFRILNTINPSFTKNQFNEMLSEYNYTELPLFDLFSDLNWSYSDEERSEYDSSKHNTIEHEKLKNISDTIPEKFKHSKGGRNSFHYINENSICDKKVLIFHDSSIHSIENFLIPYFKEIFFYWDHLNLNKKLITWYQPDIILEIRIERFLENYIYPDWVKLKEEL